MSGKPPILYIVAGPNGAGKTTASFNVLPLILDCKEFVNADEIAKGLSPFDVESVAIQAGKLMLERIDYLLDQKATFAIETTLSTRTYLSLINRVKKLGYTVELYFFWLSSPQIAINRVAKRVSNGGHNIPTEVIVRRYWRGLNNFFEKFIPLVDYWAIYDNDNKTLLIANAGIVVDKEQFKRIKESCQKRNV